MIISFNLILLFNLQCQLLVKLAQCSEFLGQYHVVIWTFVLGIVSAEDTDPFFDEDLAIMAAGLIGVITRLFKLRCQARLLLQLIFTLLLSTLKLLALSDVLMLYLFLKHF